MVEQKLEVISATGGHHEKRGYYLPEPCQFTDAIAY